MKVENKTENLKEGQMEQKEKAEIVEKGQMELEEKAENIEEDEVPFLQVCYETQVVKSSIWDSVAR